MSAVEEPKPQGGLPTGAAVLDAQNITKQFGGLTAVSDVTFTLPEKSIVSIINNYLIPDVINDLPSKFGISFDMTQITFAVYGFLLLMMMILRPQGLLPERRHQMELTEHADTSDETLYTARA